MKATYKDIELLAVYDSAYEDGRQWLEYKYNKKYGVTLLESEDWKNFDTELVNYVVQNYDSLINKTDINKCSEFLKSIILECYESDIDMSYVEYGDDSFQENYNINNDFGFEIDKEACDLNIQGVDYVGADDNYWIAVYGDAIQHVLFDSARGGEHRDGYKSLCSYRLKIDLLFKGIKEVLVKADNKFTYNLEIDGVLVDTIVEEGDMQGWRWRINTCLYEQLNSIESMEEILYFLKVLTERILLEVQKYDIDCDIQELEELSCLLDGDDLLVLMPFKEFVDYYEGSKEDMTNDRLNTFYDWLDNERIVMGREGTRTITTKRTTNLLDKIMLL